MQQKRLVKSDLRKSLPKGLNTQQKLDLLRKRTALASTIHPKKARRPRTIGAIRAGPFPLKKIESLSFVNAHSPNFSFAQKIVKIFWKSQTGEIEPSPSEQQALVNLTNNILRAEKIKEKVKFFGVQEQVLEKYSKL
ncbi:MAG TPA: hypothetical protein PKK60_00240 [archaeon]|nr:hypothetical protein [archaeon]